MIRLREAGTQVCFIDALEAVLEWRPAVEQPTYGARQA